MTAAFNSPFTMADASPGTGDVAAARGRTRARRQAGNGSPVLDWLDKLMLSTQHNTGPRWWRYFSPVPELSAGLPAPILGIMLLIWQLRERDLQPRYPLRSKQSRLDFLGWCIGHGRREYRALQQAQSLWQALDLPARFSQGELPGDDPGHAISWKMLLLLRVRPDVTPDVSTREGRAALLFWYLLHGRVDHGYGDERFQSWQTHWFFSPSALAGLNRLQALVYHARRDLPAVFALPGANSAYIAWFRKFITVETRLIDALRMPEASTAAGVANTPPGVLALPAAGGAHSDFGVNIIGHAFAQMGIGEDARMAMTALLTTDVPGCVLDFAPGTTIPQRDTSMAAHVVARARHGINLFCLPALEQARHFAECGIDTMLGRINIGYWPWELARWPREWQHLLTLVDEVWSSSAHTRDAVRQAANAKGVANLPVRLMPMAVSCEDADSLDRAAFGLPPGACLFLFAFDLNSSARRKNPKACVLAFLRAFPQAGGPGPEEVGLVIKVHPPAQPNREWEELKQLQASDARIHLIEQTLSKADLLALYRACDCFVSLHRAEGFGRCIAEAMLLGKPVMATAYSGNMSFTSEANAMLVDYELRPLARGDYPHGEDQVWAEPDVRCAARLMREVLAQPGLRRALAGKGRATVLRKHAPAVVGQRYAQALARLWAARCNFPEAGA